jgi:hypothetical protein
MSRFVNAQLRSSYRAVIPVAVFLLAVEQPAFGYTDPGSGALIWQALMAAIVGGSFYFRRIVSWLKRRRDVTSAGDR